MRMQNVGAHPSLDRCVGPVGELIGQSGPGVVGHGPTVGPAPEHTGPGPVPAGILRAMFAAPHETIAAAVVSALSSHGPLSEDELSDVLAGDGIDLGSDRKDLLAGILDEHPGPVLPLADGRWVWLPSLLGGRVFTHRLSAAEAEYDLVFVDADLTPLAMLTEMPTYQHLTDGSPVADVSPLVDGDVLAERGVPTASCPTTGRWCSGPGGSPPWVSRPATFSDCGFSRTGSSSPRSMTSRHPRSP
jgi:hypothetical protein